MTVVGCHKAEHCRPMQLPGRRVYHFGWRCSFFSADYFDGDLKPRQALRFCWRKIRHLVVESNVLRMSLCWRKRQQANATTSAKHSGKMRLPPTSVFSALCDIPMAASLAGRLHLKEGQSIDVARRQIARWNVRIDD